MGRYRRSRHSPPWVALVNPSCTKPGEASQASLPAISHLSCLSGALRASARVLVKQWSGSWLAAWELPELRQSPFHPLKLVCGSDLASSTQPHPF